VRVPAVLGVVDVPVRTDVGRVVDVTVGVTVRVAVRHSA
jgi:hypothetical protein